MTSIPWPPHRPVGLPLRWALNVAMPLRALSMLAAMLLSVSMVSGCDARAPAAPALPSARVTDASRPDLTMPHTASTDVSVPSAGAVFAGPAAQVSTDQPGSTPQARANGSLSRAQESNAMPMPGQANDHSVPVAAPKPGASR